MPLPPALPLDERLRGVTFLTIDQVADLWSVSRRTVYRLLERQEIGYVKVGADPRIPLTELEAWLARHQGRDGRPAPTALPQPRRATRPA